MSEPDHETSTKTSLRVDKKSKIANLKTDLKSLKKKRRAG
jgi:hypothetical protein